MNLFMHHFMRRIALIVLVSFACLSAAVAQENGQTSADKIAGYTSKAVYNLDTDQLQSVMAGFLAEHPEIEALVITESIDNESLFRFYVDNGQPVYNLVIPKEKLAHTRFSAIIEYDGEEIGLVELYISARSTLDLTAEERKWIADNPVIQVSSEGDWPPFNFIVDGEPKGLSIEYMNLIAEKSGLNVDYIIGPVWNDFLDMMKTRKLDVMLNIVRTPEREKYMLFTPPYAKNPNTILSRKDDTYNSLEELFGHTVAVPKGFFYEEILTRDFPEIKVLPLGSTLESMKAVQYGDAEAAFGELAVFRYLIDENFMTDLTITGEVNLGDKEYALLNISTRQDLPILQSILTKALAGISREEEQVIKNKWLQIGDQQNVNTSLEKEYGSSQGGNITLPVLFALSLGLLAAFALTIFIFSKLNTKRDLSSFFGANSFRLIVLVGLSAIVVIVATMNWIAISDSRQKEEARFKEELNIVLDSSIERLRAWVNNRKGFLEQLGHNPNLVEITKELLSEERTKNRLINSIAQEKARKFFASNKQFGETGFFIIAPDNVSIGSRRDTNVGSPNFIAGERPDLIERVFQGESLFIPPMRSDVSINAGDSQHPLTMFFAAPIIDSNGDVLAVMTERVLPGGPLSDILHYGRIGKTGETYAFNREGNMISQSRFKDQLSKIGFYAGGSENNEEIEIRDPGIDLTIEEGGIKNIAADAPLGLAVRESLKMRDADTSETMQSYNTEGYRDYRGVMVVGNWLWLKDLDLGIVSEMDYEEAFENFDSFRTNILIISLVATIMAVGTTLFTLILGQRAHKTLSEARDELEDRVLQRTADLQKSEETFKAIVNQLPVSVGIKGLDDKVLLVNDMWKAWFYPDITKVQERDTNYIYNPETAEEIRDIDNKIKLTGVPITKEMVQQFPDGATHILNMTKFPLRDGDGVIFAIAAIDVDITESKKAEADLINQSRSFEILHQIGTAVQDARTEEETYRACLNNICDFMEWGIGHVYIVSPDNPEILVSSHCWYIQEGLQVDRFKQVSEELQFSRGDGLPGRVFDSAEPEWLADITDTDKFVRAKVAKETGMSSGATFPVIFGQQVLAVIECFSMKHIEPDSSTLSLMANVGRQLGGAIRRKQAEIKIAEKEAQLSMVMENMPGAMYMVNKDLVVTQMNDQYRQFYGGKPDFIREGTSILDIIRDEIHRGIVLGEGSEDDIVAERKASFGTGDVMILEDQTPDGRFIQLTRKPAPDGSTVSIAVDITERKKAEEELGQQSAILTATLEAMDQGISMIDGNLQVMAHNSYLNELLNFPKDIFKREANLEDLFRYNAERGEYGEGNVEEMVRERVELSRKFEPHQFERTTGDGKVIEVRGNPLPDKKGFVTTYTDITERKMAEEELRVGEERLKYALQGGDLGFWDVNFATGETAHNERWAEMLGYQFEEVDDLETIANKTFHPDDADRVLAYGEEYRVGSMDKYEIEYRIITKQGETRWQLSKGFAVKRDDEGRAVRSVGTVLDITQRKEAEQEIKRSEALMSAIVENVPGGVFVLDKELNYILTNSAYRDIFQIPKGLADRGKPIEEVIRHLAPTDTYGDGEVEELVTKRLEQIKKDVPDPVEVSIDDRMYLMTYGRMPDGERIGIVPEITQLKEAEKALSDAFDLISSSINYASRIQRSILTEPSRLEPVIKDHFVIWEPRDVVGGDIYWCDMWGDGILIILADCTGHGVPGAFLTLLASGVLQQAKADVRKGNIQNLVKELNMRMQKILGQHRSDGESDDGLELGAIYIKSDLTRLKFVGARFDLFVADEGEVVKYRGTKAGLGYRNIPVNQSYDVTEIKIKPDQSFYLTTDGFLDQVGGEKHRMFGKKRFVETLEDLQSKPMAQQKDKLLETLKEYQGDEVRRDDVAVIGFKL